MSSTGLKSGHDFDVNVENYIKAIWNIACTLGAPTEAIRRTDLAKYLGITRPSVSNMIDKLVKLGFVNCETESKRILLSPSGTKKAIFLIRKHRLVESFLEKTLRLDPLTLHDEAEILEHAVSPTLTEAISQFLGNPTIDPHGMPIPKSGDSHFIDGNKKYISLVDVGELSTVKIEAIADHDPQSFVRLSKRGLFSGILLEIVNLAPNGTRTVRVGKKGEIQLIPQNEAQRIYVTLK